MRQLTLARPPFAAGLAWIRTGWLLFKPSAIAWTGMTALVFMLLIGLSSLPGIGGLFAYVLSPFLVAGFFAAAQAARAGEIVTFFYLAAGFREAPRQLAIIGLFNLLATLLVFKIVMSLTGGDLEMILQQTQNPASIDPQKAEELIRQMLPSLLLGLGLLTPLLMATWFSPGLVQFDGFTAGKALWWSLWACLVNWRPLLHFSLLVGMIGVLAMLIPFGLGLLVFMPLALAATYAAYRDIFIAIIPETEHESPAAGGADLPAGDDRPG
jgi:uncharacterized membrane protein